MGLSGEVSPSTEFPRMIHSGPIGRAQLPLASNIRGCLDEGQWRARPASSTRIFVFRPTLALEPSQSWVASRVEGCRRNSQDHNIRLEKRKLPLQLGIARHSNMPETDHHQQADQHKQTKKKDTELLSSCPHLLMAPDLLS